MAAGRTISIRLAVEDADRVKALLQSVGATGEEALSAFERGATRGAQSFAALERSLDPAVGAQQRFATAQTNINRAVESGLASQDRANQLLDLARQRYLSAAGAAETMHATASRGFGNMSQVIGQAGYQLQDFVVQVGAGQNALVALSQQGSQFLGIFGTGGAIAGAALAIGAVAANFFTSGKSAEEAAKLAEQSFKNVSEGQRDLAKAIEDVNNLYLTQAERASAAGRASRESLGNLLSLSHDQLIQRNEGNAMELVQAQRELAEAEAGIRRRQEETFARTGSRVSDADRDNNSRLFTARARIQGLNADIDRVSRRIGEVLEARRQLEEAPNEPPVDLSHVVEGRAAGRNNVRDDAMRLQQSWDNFWDRADQKAQERATRQQEQSTRTREAMERQLELVQAEGRLVTANVEDRQRELAVLRERQKLDSENETNEERRASRLSMAARIADETSALRRQQEAWNELSNVGVQAFDRIGTAITQAFANGQLSTIRFGNIAKSVASEVMQYFAKLAIVNPIMNAVFGSNRTTLGAVGGLVGSVFGGSAPASAGGGTLTVDGIPTSAYQALPENAQGPVLSLPSDPVYGVAGSVSGLDGLGSGRVLAAGAASGGGIMSQLGMLSSGGSILNQLSGGSLYGGIGRYLGLSGSDGGGLLGGLGNSVTEFLNTPLFANLAEPTNAALNSMGGMMGPATPEAVQAAGGSVGLGTIGEVAGGVLGLAGGAYGIYSGIQKGGVGGGFEVAGGAVTTAAAASSLLASAGIISASMGPIGWIAGAVLAIIGALLPGQKPSNMEGNATYDFASDVMSVGGQTGAKYSAANRAMAQSMVGGVVDVAARLEKTIGLTFGQKIQIGVGNRDGLYYRVDESAARQYGRDDDGAKRLARDLIQEITVQSAGSLAAGLRVPLQNGVKWDTLESALQQIEQLYQATNKARPSANQNIAAGNIDWTDFNNGLADLKWVADVFDKLGQSESPAAKFARQLETLNAQFDNTAEKARQLGLSEATVNAARQQQIQQAYNQRDLEGLKLIQSQQAQLTSFLDNVTYQNASPSERLRLAQGLFGKAVGAARAADLQTADLGAVAKAGQTLLSAGQAFYGTGGGAADLERFVRSTVESLGAQLNLPAFGGDFATAMEQATNPLKDEMTRLADQVALLREELRTARLLAAA